MLWGCCGDGDVLRRSGREAESFLRCPVRDGALTHVRTALAQQPHEGTPHDTPVTAWDPYYEAVLTAWCSASRVQPERCGPCLVRLLVTLLRVRACCTGTALYGWLYMRAVVQCYHRSLRTRYLQERF